MGPVVGAGPRAGHDERVDASSELRVGAFVGGGTAPAGVAGLVRSLSLAVLLQWAGAGAILPLLPLYVKAHGGSDAIVGAVMAAYFAAGFVFQYGAGRVSDRLGRLPVLVGGLFVYAAGSALFLVPAPPVFDVVFRALQGAGAGGAMVAALATISHAVPLAYRGRATGRIYGAELGGLAVGPVLGSIAGVGAMRWLFVAAGAASIAAVGPVLVARRAAAAAAVAAEAEAEAGAATAAEAEAGAATAAEAEAGAATAAAVATDVPDVSRGTWTGSTVGTTLTSDAGRRAVRGALLASAAIGVSVGVYEACWTLLMTRHGAAAWEVGVSWTLFALPFALVSRPAGWLADHVDRRWLGVGALVWIVGFLAGYPFVPWVVLLMVLSVWESAGLAFVLPVCQSLLGQGTTPERHGHAQGLFAASQTGTTALAAAGAGALFGVAAWLPFDVGASCCVLVVGAAAASWRRVPGRVRRNVSVPGPSARGHVGTEGLAGGRGPRCGSATT